MHSESLSPRPGHKLLPRDQAVFSLHPQGLAHRSSEDMPSVTGWAHHAEGYLNKLCTFALLRWAEWWFPQTSDVPISGTFEPVIHGKRDFTNVITLRFRKWGLFGWVQCNHKDPCKRDSRGSDLEKAMWEWKLRPEWCRASGQEMQAASRRWKRKGVRFSSKASKKQTNKKTSLPTRFGLLQNGKIKKNCAVSGHLVCDNLFWQP